MRYLRKLQNTNPGAGCGKYPSISIPKELSDIFKTDTAIIEPFPNRKGVTIRPASVEPLV
jgi:hypothetical protein